MQTAVKKLLKLWSSPIQKNSLTGSVQVLCCLQTPPRNTPHVQQTYKLMNWSQNINKHWLSSITVCSGLEVLLQNRCVTLKIYF